MLLLQLSAMDSSAERIVRRRLANLTYPCHSSSRQVGSRASGATEELDVSQGCKVAKIKHGFQNDGYLSMSVWICRLSLWQKDIEIESGIGDTRLERSIDKNNT